ncbi:hypothetical protein ECG_03380 [Echinococcus granulosus]|uniref:Zinc finger FLYWCH type n=1 Tax=Echinococcus granulosus TaxID=6210 RepID=A0A068WZP0_ECHGR|nr:hypothetical protein ECG_03380 [Echinococcus granulosus]CDS23971.1 Zinc finger FLYWCH type [Echinococcus granulosus]
MIFTDALPANANPTEPATQTASKTVGFVQEKVENANLLGGQLQTSATKLDKWNLMKVRVGFDVTRKGERSLVIDGYKFTKSRDGMSDRVFWRCSRRECKATAVTVGGRVEHVRILHTHKPPTPGEFFSSSATATATTTTTTTEPISRLDMSARSNPTGRVRRRSHQQQQRQQQLQHQTVKSVNEGTGKNDCSYPRAVAAILSNVVERRQVEQKLSTEPETGNDCGTTQENCFQAANQQQQLPQLVSPGSLSQEGSQKYPHFNEIDSRGLSTLADAAAHQSKRDSQNSTPDPPFEASGSSPSLSQATPANHLLSPLIPSESGTAAATTVSGQFVLLGPRGLSAPLLVGSSPDVPFLPTSPYLSNCTRRFSVSEMPFSSRNSLHKSLIQPELSQNHQATIPPASYSNLTEAGSRGVPPTVLTSTSAVNSGGVGMLLHWKKEKMLESKAEEEMKQHRRRRHFTGSSAVVAPPSDVSTGASTAATVVAMADVNTAFTTPPLKRKRCASACHPLISSPSSSSYSLPTVSAMPNAHGMNDSAATASPQSISGGGGGGTDQEPASDWCARVQNDLLTQMFTTLQQLAARLSADLEADSVVANCRAIQACLDTISAIKRARQEVLNASCTP